MAKLGQAVAAAKGEYDSAAARLDELRQRLQDCDREIGALAADKATLAQQLTDLAVDKKRLQHKCALPCWHCCMHTLWPEHLRALLTASGSETSASCSIPLGLP